MRPSDWFLVDYNTDPTPGDAFGIRALAAKYDDIATIAGDASMGVRNARSSGAIDAWVGDAGDIFRDRSHRMPGELAKANDSYAIVAEALRSWAESVDDTQAQADRGLQQAREAHADLTSAQAVLNSAQSSWSTVHAQQLSYQKLQKDYASVPPPANVTMPTPDQLRSTTRNAQQAQSSIASAQSRINDADARLAAAKALVHAAKERRDDAERTVVHKIGQAEDRAVKPSSIWEAIQDSAAWQVIVQVATVVLTIITIVAIFVGGPLVWAIIIAATVLLMVNALMSIAQGKDAWGELIMLGIGLIPGGRLLGLAAKGVDLLARTGSVGARAATLIRVSAGAISRFGSAGVDMIVGTLNRAADAALPRLMPLLRNGASAAIERLDSLMNPKWLSHFGADPTAAGLRDLPGHGAPDSGGAAGGQAAAGAGHPGASGGTQSMMAPPRDPAVVAAEHAQVSTGYQADVWTGADFPSGHRIAMGLNVPADLGPYSTIVATPHTGFAMSVDLPGTVGNKAEGVWQELQVEPSPIMGYRHFVGFFESTTPTHGAEATALANTYKPDLNGVPQFLGHGGGAQEFHPDFLGQLDKGDYIYTDANRNPLPFEVVHDAHGVPTGVAFYPSRPQHVIHLS